MFGARNCEVCSGHFAALEYYFLLGRKLLHVPLALTDICFRSVLRYFLKSERAVGRDCAYSESFWAGRGCGM